MSKMINIVEDLHKGIDMNELAKQSDKKQVKQPSIKEEESNEQHQGHGK